MKYTIEVTPNGIVKTFEFEGQKFSETWVRDDNYSSKTTGKGITAQLEEADILQDEDDLLDALEFDELHDVWDAMEYFK